MFEPNFETLGTVIPDKSLTQISLSITLEWEMGKKKENGKKKPEEISALWFSFTQDTSTVCMCTQNLKTGSHRSWEICDEKFYCRKRKKRQIKGMIRIRMLILSYMIQQVIPNVCTKFQNPRWSSSWEILDEKKKKKKKFKKLCFLEKLPSLKDRQTHTNIVMEEMKTIYPPSNFVCLCLGYNKNVYRNFLRGITRLIFGGL